MPIASKWILNCESASRGRLHVLRQLTAPVYTSLTWTVHRTALLAAGLAPADRLVQGRLVVAEHIQVYWITLTAGSYCWRCQLNFAVVFAIFGESTKQINNIVFHKMKFCWHLYPPASPSTLCWAQLTPSPVTRLTVSCCQGDVTNMCRTSVHFKKLFWKSAPIPVLLCKIG